MNEHTTDRAADRLDRMHDALTASGDTKAAYSAEFLFEHNGERVRRDGWSPRHKPPKEIP